MLFASPSREFSKEFYKARDFEGRTDFSVGNETPGNFDYPYNKLFTLDEIKAALSSCGEGAPGPDEIFSSMLRLLHPTTSAFLLDLYRLIFITGTFPSIWRKSIVVPIPKQGKDPMVDSNQRPISMTCNTCKSMEKMVANRLLWELEALGALSASQFGFLRFRSTSDPLMLEQNIRL